MCATIRLVRISSQRGSETSGGLPCTELCRWLFCHTSLHFCLVWHHPDLGCFRRWPFPVLGRGRLHGWFPPSPGCCRLGSCWARGSSDLLRSQHRSRFPPGRAVTRGTVNTMRKEKSLCRGPSFAARNIEISHRGFDTVSRTTFCRIFQSERGFGPVTHIARNIHFGTAFDHAHALGLRGFEVRIVAGAGRGLGGPLLGFRRAFCASNGDHRTLPFDDRCLMILAFFQIFFTNFTHNYS